MSICIRKGNRCKKKDGLVGKDVRRKTGWPVHTRGRKLGAVGKREKNISGPVTVEWQPLWSPGRGGLSGFEGQETKREQGPHVKTKKTAESEVETDTAKPAGLTNSR